MMTKGNLLRAMAILCMGVAVSCKKSDVKTPEPPVDPPVGGGNTKQTPTTNRVELTNDSIFLYAQQVYYWNTTLPGYDAYEPRKYTSGSTNLDKYENNLFNLIKASNSPEYVSGSNSIKYSYIDDTDDNNVLSVLPARKSAVELSGIGNDIGLRAVSYIINDARAYLLFIVQVYDGSPADKAGLRRGDVIEKINGASVGANYDAEAALRAPLGSASVTIQGSNYADRKAFTKNLVKQTYKSSAVDTSAVLNVGGKKIGYLSFARFSELSASGSSSASSSDVNLDPAFAKFAAEGITDLVVDLRYNGGGYVETAKYMVNLIAPSTVKTTDVMFTEYFNQTMQKGQATILKNQPLLDRNGKLQYIEGRIATYFDIPYSETNPQNIARFEKKGPLTGVKNVTFIVAAGTASASELVINSLRPYVNVKIVGEKTYGKPIGFFPITIEKKYDVYFSLFETKNALGQGGYYGGMQPDAGYADEFDDPRYQFGDVRENYLSLALKTLGVQTAATTASTGQTLVSPKTMSLKGGGTVSVKTFTAGRIKPVRTGTDFVGMVATPKLK
ncbi:S41 family peptidase [Pedobacter yulinensis]|nr:S41 family peptidase [Pedobacter yulinensis]